MPEESPSAGSPPTRTRYLVGLWLGGLAVVLYLDRLCMSQALVPLQKELDLTNTELSRIGIAFTLAYGIFEIPSGRWGDRFGSRRVLSRIVLWWSVFTMLTGVCTGFYSLLLVRFLFGAGEAGAFPNGARVVTRWFPLLERGKAQGWMLASAQIGGVAAPAATAWLIELIGWRGTFWVFGFLGIAWALGFWWWFRDDPATHPRVSPQELALIHSGKDATLEKQAHAPVPWRSVLSNRGILTLCSLMIVGAFFTYLIYVWFPKYLQNARKLDNISAGNWTSVVILGSAVGMLLGGWLGDRISRLHTNPVNSRRYLGVVCYLLASLFLGVGTLCEDHRLFAGLWALAFLAFHVTLPNWWLLAMRQGGSHVGSLSGLMNGIGSAGAILSQWFVGYFTDSRKAAGLPDREQWDPMFLVYAAVLLAGAGIWWTYKFTPLVEPLQDDNPEKSILA